MKKKPFLLLGIVCLTGGIMLTGCNDRSKEIKTIFEMPSGIEPYSIQIEAIPDLPDDFYRGMDISSILAEEKSGVVYYDFEGQKQDPIRTLAEAGINHARIRIWNDPYDEAGHGYGGGNNDLETAAILGKRASDNGMRVCIDFHYSDFWADPKRQLAPKSWQQMSLEQKKDALYQYTKESLSILLEEGVNVTMVQIGNEINYGMAGEQSDENVITLLQAGSQAVRELSKQYQKEIQIAVHYTDIAMQEQLYEKIQKLSDHKLDYDIIAISYYPFWHGTIENMQQVVSKLTKEFGKQVVIAETSYCYTLKDGDGYGNTISDIHDLVKGYQATKQGQANMIRDIVAASHEAGASGVFYWEGAWIPVGDGSQDHSSIWEEYGSGWASSYAAEYDPSDAGLYYGGCAWENQAMFDFTGHPLDSLNVWKYLKYGTK